jgi:hypothetical protein
MQLCIYGCGQTAKYQFKNGKWCCSKSKNSCPVMRKKNKEGTRGKKRSIKFKQKMSKLMMGKNNHMFGTKGYWYGKKRSRDDKEKFRISHLITIDQIKNKYPFFSKIEEMRYNPHNPKEKEIQVHCKNHNCPNSKEGGGWFTPTYAQLYERIRALERPHGMIENNFYCSDRCKNMCPLYNLKNDPFTDVEMSYTHEEYQNFRKYILERDDYKCQFCEEPATDVHHERPQKLEPFFALDPDLAWSCCKPCHYKKGHVGECSTGNLAQKICI